MASTGTVSADHARSATSPEAATRTSPAATIAAPDQVVDARGHGPPARGWSDIEDHAAAEGLLGRGGAQEEAIAGDRDDGKARPQVGEARRPRGQRFPAEHGQARQAAARAVM